MKKKSHFFDRFLYSNKRFTIITCQSKWRDTFLNRKFLACNFTSVNAITLRVRVALIIDSMFHEGSREPPRQRGQFPSERSYSSFPSGGRIISTSTKGVDFLRFFSRRALIYFSSLFLSLSLYVLHYKKSSCKKNKREKIQLVYK